MDACAEAAASTSGRGQTLLFAALYGPTVHGSMARCRIIGRRACCLVSVVLLVRRVGYGVYRALHELFELMVCGLFVSGGDRAFRADGYGVSGALAHDRGHGGARARYCSHVM